MDVMAPDVPSDAATRKRIAKALRLLTGPLPHLAGLAAAVRVQLDASVPTMGVFASGRLLANPAFTARLKDNELIFVLAHELLHLALRTHDRARGSGRLEFNYAHDYIINDILRTELGFAAIPAGGLDMPGARHRSAEEIVLEMRRNAETMPARSRVFEGRAASMRSVLGGGDSDDAGDVLTDAREREMFPQDADAQEKRRRAIEEIAARGAALAAAAGALRGRGIASAGTATTVTAIRNATRPAWQRALQTWIEATSPGERTFTRPSRRASTEADIVLPGRRRTSSMLNVVLDTSGSMTQIIPVVLGAVADFCDSAGVDAVRLLQCDTAVTADEIVAPEALSQFRIAGFGGSDLSPALLALADDAQVTAAVVITDGEVTIPSQPVPYGVLWVLPADHAAFDPPYGQILRLEGMRG
jgi:predicted metal-dependent peptidase